MSVGLKRMVNEGITWRGSSQAAASVYQQHAAFAFCAKAGLAGTHAHPSQHMRACTLSTIVGVSGKSRFVAANGPKSNFPMLLLQVHVPSVAIEPLLLRKTVSMIEVHTSHSSYRKSGGGGQPLSRSRSMRRGYGRQGSPPGPFAWGNRS